MFHIRHLAKIIIVISSQCQLMTSLVHCTEIRNRQIRNKLLTTDFLKTVAVMVHGGYKKGLNIHLNFKTFKQCDV